MCQNCDDPEIAEIRHGLSRHERLQRDPAYADWVYEQERDRDRAKEKEERPPCDHAILRALFDTIPTVFAKEENRWTGLTKRQLKRGDDHE